MNKKIYLGIAALLIIIAIFRGISPPQSATYKIGIMVPLTGKSASFGERVKNGVNLALNDLKTSHKIIPIFEDDKGEAASAVTVANKLISVDKVHIIIGTVKSDAMLAVAPITEKNKVILFSPTAGAASISQAGDFVFRNIETPAIHGTADANFFVSKNIRNTAVFIANASNAQGYGNAFIESFKSQGILVATSTYNQDDTDFRTLISKVLSQKPEGVFMAVATAKDAGFLVRQLREQNFTGVILASVAADAKEFFDTALASAENTYVSTSYFDPSIEPTLSYNKKFKAAYGSDSDAFSANAYDAVMLISQAIEKCGDDTECIRDFLYSTKDYPGVSGTTTFDSKGDVIKPVAIKVARAGRFIVVQD